jgi:hypothetical protein
MSKWMTIVVWGLTFVVTQGVQAESSGVPNADFRLEEGENAPHAWQLNGTGRWVDREVLEVTGSGDDSSYWWTSEVEMTPGHRYHFEFRGRRVGGGSAITGPVFANRDQAGLTDAWQWLGHVFRVPDSGGDGRLRLGHWHATGAIQFDAVRLTPTLPIYRQQGELVLGEGETVRGDLYHFAGTYGHPGSNDHRVLQRTTTSFNSDRWTFGAGTEVIYRFQLPGVRLMSAEIEFDVNYYVRGACRLEVSQDGQNWLLLAEQGTLGTARAQAPDALLPAEQLFVRLRPAEGAASFQVNRLDVRAKLDRLLPEMAGETVYADLRDRAEHLAIRRIVLQRDSETGAQHLDVHIARQSGAATVLDARLTSVGASPAAARATISSDDDWKFRLSLPQAAPGEQVLTLEIRDEQGAALVADLTMRVPDFYRTDCGYRLAAGTEPVALWWCDATRKVPRQRPVPEAVGDAIRLEAARHDYEAAQIIVRPATDLAGLTAEASELVGPGGHRLPAASIEILWVYYHYVQHPTDGTGVRDWWPDALPPLDKPLDVAAGQNQPLWVLVYVPEDAPAGEYSGSVRLTAEGFAAEVPLKLRVWDFALPKRNHLETAFGLSASTIWQYHGVKTEEDRRRVLDMYLESFAKHRISPYDPAPLDPIRVRFVPDAQPPRAEVDSSAFATAITRAVERFRFTGFRLPIQGMGGGTFHARYEPKIGHYGEETPEYEAMFADYVGQLEQLLAERGWLDLAYVYWFDEPAPPDYDFVANGMQRLKKHAPGLRRMLTEEPGDNVLAGLVDIWCPVSHHYDHQQAEKRRALGERFWWYVCTGPKAPYCTLFIDHPATELRVWHWQTWQRGIVGTLVWQSNYWTSSAAFPDQPQNPYDDPMGYVSGYSTPRGVKRFWGNGDGRFLYPPLAASVPGRSGSDPVIEPPVSSIRWEMLREGVEDYEMLYLLRQRLAEKQSGLPKDQNQAWLELLEVPPSITTDMTTFATDPTPIYERRRAVAEAIEALVD